MIIPGQETDWLKEEFFTRMDVPSSHLGNCLNKSYLTIQIVLLNFSYEEEFMYPPTYRNLRKDDITSRITKARTMFVRLRQVSQSREAQNLPKTVLLHGCETWKVTELHATTPGFVNRCPSQTLSIFWPESLWQESPIITYGRFAMRCQLIGINHRKWKCVANAPGGSKSHCPAPLKSKLKKRPGNEASLQSIVKEGVYDME
ncbi:unnamed protein product [Pieris macdunnoughi]|uniref:Uncharacterized protein n=1 Tax=Pieris macdunnoughi TaxID=345717 RepID=A0A821MXF7_9NEOP|nr:unnamed protein product [Pieris macdunnoughi]